MKVGIYAASGDITIKDTSIDFIAVDRGYDYLVKKNITPIYTIGDFDSIKDKEIITGNVTVLSSVKDDTDTQVAIDKAIELGYNEIDLYGVTGGRLDHFIAVIRLLVKYSTISITIYDNNNKVYLLKKGSYQIEKNKYQYVSFFSIRDTLISIQGVTYPLTNYQLCYEDALCISNEIIDAKCKLEITDDVLVIQSNDR